MNVIVTRPPIIQVPYPPAPWRSAGQIHLGLFRAAQAAPLGRSGFRPLGDGRWLAIAAIRYQEGSLCYDELAIGPLVHRGLRPGIWVRDIYVNDEASLRGGRELWGLPKQLARFAFHDGGLTVNAGDEPLIDLAFQDRGRAAPRLPLLCPGFGNRDGRWTYVTVRFTARLARARMEVRALSPRLPALAEPMARVAFGSARFDAFIGPPTLLDDRGAP